MSWPVAYPLNCTAASLMRSLRSLHCRSLWSLVKQTPSAFLLRQRACVFEKKNQDKWIEVFIIFLKGAKKMAKKQEKAGSERTVPSVPEVVAFCKKLNLTAEQVGRWV